MISEYLKKFQSELMSNKEEIHKSVEALELQIKENKAFIKLLKEENDSNYDNLVQGMLIRRAEDRSSI